jgi:GNAT superfamily N-acetyltransferase
VTWEIRRASESDAATIAEVHVSAWQVAYRGLVPRAALDELSVDQHRKEWLEHLRKPASKREWVWVATCVGQVLGFAFVAPSEDSDQDRERVVELIAVYVRPNAWGQGAGRGLIEQSLQTAGREGYERMTLWVLEANRRARRLYHRLGFKPDGTRELRPIGGTGLPMLRYAIDTLVSGAQSA